MTLRDTQVNRLVPNWRTERWLNSLNNCFRSHNKQTKIAVLRQKLYCHTKIIETVSVESILRNIFVKLIYIETKNIQSFCEEHNQ